MGLLVYGFMKLYTERWEKVNIPWKIFTLFLHWCKVAGYHAEFAGVVGTLWVWDSECSSDDIKNDNADRIKRQSDKTDKEYEDRFKHTI